MVEGYSREGGLGGRLGRERSEQGEDSGDRAREGRAISGGHGRLKAGWNRDRISMVGSGDELFLQNGGFRSRRMPCFRSSIFGGDNQMTPRALRADMKASVRAAIRPLAGGLFKFAVLDRRDGVFALCLLLVRST